MPQLPLALQENFRQRWPLWLLAAVMAALQANWLAPVFMDADLLMQPLMSTQKVTLFYWGQERFANVLPLLLSPIADLWTNLALHLWANAFAYFLLLETTSHVLCQLWGQPPTRLRRALLFCLLTGLPLLLLRPFALYQFSVGAQPYALSFLLLLWAGLAWRIRAQHRAAYGVCVLSLVAASGLNPAVILLVAALLVLQVWQQQWRPWLGFALLALAALGIWTLLSRMYPMHSPSSFLAFAPRSFPAALQASVADLRHNAIRPRYFALLAVMLLALLWIRPAPKLPQVLRQALLATLALSVGWWLFFLANQWVQVNGAVFRYFMPLIFSPVLVLATGLAWWIEFASPRPLQPAVALACVLVFASSVARPWTPLREYGAFTAAESAHRLAQSRHIRYFAGDYWVTWPVVFLLRADNISVFGAFSRGIALREEIRAELQRDRAPVALCIQKPLPTCQDQLHTVTGLLWSQAVDLPATEGNVFLTPSR